MKKLAAFALQGALFGALGLASGCATVQVIPGTHVTDTRVNRQLLEVTEKYRHALEDRDAETLVQMASPLYFEDSGTPKAEDDYGFDGLKQVINTRLAALKNVRYNIDYRSIKTTSDPPHKGTRAAVEIRYDASYQIGTEVGDRWERKQNEKVLELEYDGSKWLFVSGM
jgi:hypothetical protein